MGGAAYIDMVADTEEGDGADSVGDGGRCWRTVPMVVRVAEVLRLLGSAVAVPQRCNPRLDIPSSDQEKPRFPCIPSDW